MGHVARSGGGRTDSFAAEGVDGDTALEISNLVVLSRVDKRKDRCEISPQQLVEASGRAEVRAAAG